MTEAEIKELLAVVAVHVREQLDAALAPIHERLATLEAAAKARADTDAQP